jgi:hypothetical protein
MTFKPWTDPLLRKDSLWPLVKVGNAREIKVRCKRVLSQTIKYLEVVEV